MKSAISYFEAALRHGSPFEAYYYLAEIQFAQMKILPSALRAGACSMATSFYKVVAERGSWEEDLIRDGEEAWETGTPSGRRLALLRWWIAAERGFEIGQNNLAFILDQGTFSPRVDGYNRRGCLCWIRQEHAPPRRFCELLPFERHGTARPYPMDSVGRTEQC